MIRYSVDIFGRIVKTEDGKVSVGEQIPTIKASRSSVPEPPRRSSVLQAEAIPPTPPITPTKPKGGCGCWSSK